MNTFKISRCDASIKGFTLVELLTVIAIVAVLAGILIPVVGRVRASARQTQCSAQLRSIHQTILLYQGDNKMTYPPAFGGVIDSKYTWWWYKVDSPLAAYGGTTVGRSWLSNCLCVEGQPTGSANLQPQGVPGYPYAVNYNIMPNYNSVIKFSAIPAFAVQRPASTILMMDSSREGAWGVGFSSIVETNNWSRTGEMHNGRANILWCDGHVSALARKDVTALNCQL